MFFRKTDDEVIDLALEDLRPIDIQMSRPDELRSIAIRRREEALSVLDQEKIAKARTEKRIAEAESEIEALDACIAKLDEAGL